MRAFLCDRYLSLGNLRDANCLMDELKKQLKGKDLDFPKSIWCQCLIIFSDSKFVFKLLHFLNAVYEARSLYLCEILRGCAHTYETCHMACPLSAYIFMGERTRVGKAGWFFLILKAVPEQNVYNFKVVGQNSDMERMYIGVDHWSVIHWIGVQT